VERTKVVHFLARRISEKFDLWQKVNVHERTNGKNSQIKFINKI